MSNINDFCYDSEPSGHGHVCDSCGAQWDCFDLDCKPGLTTCGNCLDPFVFARPCWQRNRLQGVDSWTIAVDDFRKDGNQ